MTQVELTNAPLPERPTQRSVGLSGRAALQLLLVPLAATVGGFGAALLSVWLLPGLRDQIVEILAWTLLTLSALILVLFAVVAKRHRVGAQNVGFARPTLRLLHLLWQIPTMFLLILVVQATFATALDLQPPQRSMDMVFRASAAGVVAAAVATSILVPLWEEITFRGVLYQFFRRRLGTLAAVTLTALVFAIAHAAPVLLLYMVTLGLCLGLIRAFHKNLWAAVIAHASLNTLVSVLVLGALV